MLEEVNQIVYDVYLITNLLNDKKYVGITSKGYKKRFKGHIKESRQKNPVSPRFVCRAIRKYGEKNFQLDLLSQVHSHKEACELEKYFIQKYNTFAYSSAGHGYNQTLGGDGTDGHNVSQELREKTSARLIEAKAWVGEKNPKFGKGHLMRGNNNMNYGKPLSELAKAKIGQANKGRLSGEKNHATVKCTNYAKECATGNIIKAESFYALRTILKNKGIIVNRSVCLSVIRGDRKTHKGYIFYREDITPASIMAQLEDEYQRKVATPIIIKDHRIGIAHPNVRKEMSFSKNLKDGKLTKFDSWYELVSYMRDHVDKNYSHSAMYNVLCGKYKSSRGFVFYRKDVTDAKVFAEISKQFENQQSKPSTTSREA